MSSHKGRLLKNFVSLSLAEVLARLMGAFLNIWIVRVFGVAPAGVISFSTAFVSFFNIFSDFGLTVLGIKEISKDKEKTNQYGSGILFIQLTITFFLILLLFASLLFIPGNFNEKLIIVIFGLTMIPTAFDMSYIFQAHQLMKYISVTRVLTQVTYTLLGFILIYIFRDIISLSIASLISLILGSVITYFLLRKFINFKIVRVDFQRIKILLTKTLPFITAAFFSNIYHNLDFVMINFMFGPEMGSTQVGYYALGYKIVNILLIFVSYISGVFFPHITSSLHEGEEKFKKNSFSLVQYMGVASLPITFGGIFYAKDILVFLYSANNVNVDSIISFQIVLLLLFLIGLNIAISNIIIAIDLQKHNTISVFVGAVVNLILNFILIPKFGIIGAAISTICAEVAVCVYLAIIYALRFKDIHKLLLRFFAKPLLATFLMVSFMYICGLNLLFGIILGGVFYSLVIFLIKGVDTEVVYSLIKSTKNRII